MTRYPKGGKESDYLIKCFSWDDVSRKALDKKDTKTVKKMGSVSFIKKDT